MASLLSDTTYERQRVPERQVPRCIANLSGGMEEYFGRLSSNSRAQARRLLRAVDAANLSFEVATQATVDESTISSSNCIRRDGHKRDNPDALRHRASANSIVRSHINSCQRRMRCLRD